MAPELSTADRLLQAQKFVAYFRRVGGNLDQVFAFWADGKDFDPGDREAIWLLVDAAVRGAKARLR